MVGILSSIQDLPEQSKLAIYGAFFAMADADSEMHPKELELILNSLKADGLPASARAEVESYATNPPPLIDCLKRLSDAPDEIRYGILYQLALVAWVDNILRPEEEYAFLNASIVLGASKDQLNCLLNYAYHALRCAASVADGHRSSIPGKVLESVESCGIPSSALSLFALSTSEDFDSLPALSILVTSCRQKKKDRARRAIFLRLLDKGNE